MTAVSERSRFEGIQILRTVAAVLVLIHHGWYYTAQEYSGVSKLFFRIDLGSAGVYLFFVISGYVIARLIETPPRLYAMHRVFRIYPPFFASVIIGGTLTIGLGIVSADSVTFNGVLLLLPTGQSRPDWALIPYWTLLYEAVFYALTFFLMLGGPKLFDRALVVWTLAIVVPLVGWRHAPPQETTHILQLLIAPHCLFSSRARRLHASTRAVRCPSSPSASFFSSVPTERETRLLPRPLCSSAWPFRSCTSWSSATAR